MNQEMCLIPAIIAIIILTNSTFVRLITALLSIHPFINSLINSFHSFCRFGVLITIP